MNKLDELNQLAMLLTDRAQFMYELSVDSTGEVISGEMYAVSTAIRTCAGLIVDCLELEAVK